MHHWLQQTPQLGFAELVQLLEQNSCSPVRFASHPGLGHARRQVEQVKRVDSGGGHHYLQVTVNFPGLLGAASPLPANQLEQLAAQPADSLALLLVRIIDHHLLQRDYRLWRDSQVFGPAWMTLRNSLRGMAAGGPGEALLPPWYAGVGSAAAIRALLGRVLPRVRVELQPWRPLCLPLEQDQSARCGAPLGGALGRRVLVYNSCLRLLLHNVDMEQWQSLLPGAEHWQLLRAISSRLLPDVAVVEVLMFPASLPDGYRRCGRGPARLGRSLWLAGAGAAPLRLQLR